MTDDLRSRCSHLLPAAVRTRQDVALAVRLLTQEDAPMLGRYFGDLSQRTRDVYAPHPFDQATADRLCQAVASDHAWRLIATATHDGQNAIVAYFILQMTISHGEMERYTAYGLNLDPQRDSLLAPSVADAYQSAGVGAAVMGVALDLLRAAGRRLLVLQGGVQERNARARAFYQRFGFREVGRFQTHLSNIDMLMSLGGMTDIPGEAGSPPT